MASSEKLLEVYVEEATTTEAWPRRPALLHLSLSHSINCMTRHLTAPSRLLCLLIPSFVQNWFEKDHGKYEKVHETAYLDGMRGLAAFAVFLCHLSYGTFDITKVYGAGEPGENNWLLQLPIVRLVYGGPPMVAIFFVISGYALSYKPMKLMRAQQFDKFMTTVSSSVFRRGLRLFLPCFASTFIVACFAQMGFYKMTQDFAEDMRMVHEDHPWTADNATAQFVDWGHQMFDFVQVFDWRLYAGSIPLDRHLWTIPVEFRCSMVLFLTHVMVARMSTKLRISTLLALIWWGLHQNRWDLCPFWAGALLAELDLRKSTNSLNTDPTWTPEHESKPRNCNTAKICWSQCFYFLTWTSGLYLASFPDSMGHATPGYRYLDSLIPEYFTEKHRFWPTVAAVQIVWSTSHLPCLKKIFSCSSLQYLGKISFALYVMHGPVIHTFGYTMMDKMWDVVEYTSSEDERWRLERGFIVAALSTILAVIWAADVFWRLVDIPCVKFARWVESCFFVS